MSKTFSELCIIFFITLIIFIYIVKSNENESEDYEYETIDNNTENIKSYNTSDDYDYNNLNDDEDEDNQCDKQSFIQKVKLIHDEGKNNTLRKNVKHINETFDVFKNVRKNFNSLFATDGRGSLEILEFLSEIDIQLTSECFSALTKILSGVRSGDLWALKFLDSIGSFVPSGLAEGIRSSFGEYYECLDIKSPKTENNAEVTKGQYCLMKVILPFPPMDSYKTEESDEEGFGFSARVLKSYNLHKLSSVKVRVEELNLSNGTIYNVGICIPSVCRAHEIEDMLNKISHPLTGFPLEIGPNCHIKDQAIVLDNFQLSSLIILLVLAILVIMSTGFEIYIKRNELEVNEKVSKHSTKMSDLLISFSIMKNTRSLNAVNTKFASLDTIRLLLIINIHISHIYHYTTSLGLLSLKKIYSEVMSKIYEDNRYIFARNPLIMDALFTLSGFLLSYGLLKKLKKTSGRFNYIEFLFKRWIRFLILMFGSIIFFYLYPLFGDGPIWEEGVKWVTTGCKNPQTLLKQFFFVNNFRPVLRDQLSIANQSCNEVTWFLSTLFQLIIIATIFIIIYFKKPILGFYAIICAIIISLLASISPQILFGIKPYLQIWDLETIVFYNSESFKWYNITPNAYALSFFVGIAFGFLMRKEISFTRLQERIFWILSPVMIITVYFWHNSFWRLDESAPLWSVLLWHSIGKLFFSIGFAWIYYACCTGRGGFLNRFLSWHGFRPIARLSFGIYLLQNLVVMHRIFSTKEIYVMTDKLMFEHIIVDLIYDIFLAYIFYILIEGPFVNIFNVIFNRKTHVKLEHFNNETYTSKL